MNTPHEARTSRTAGLEDSVIELISDQGNLRPGEVAVHFDLVVTTRWFGADGQEKIDRRHWAPRGADPHLSYGTLNAQAVKILSQIT